MGLISCSGSWDLSVCSSGFRQGVLKRVVSGGVGSLFLPRGQCVLSCKVHPDIVWFIDK